MAVVTVRIFQVTTSPYALSQTNLDNHATTVNTFLATLLALNVLDVKSTFAPGGKDGIRSTFVTEVIYLV